MVPVSDSCLNIKLVWERFTPPLPHEVFVCGVSERHI